MIFFNSKEDVLDIQFTSYGKHLVSEGKFKPAYYSFLDDEIIYDYGYCNISESQNNIQTRIKDNVRLGTQAIFNGVETNVKKVNKLIRSGIIKFEEGERLYHMLDNLYSFPASLGNSQISTENAPAWKVFYLNGEITGSVYYITGSHQLLRIPRMSSSVTYETSVEMTDPVETDNSIFAKPSEDRDRIYSDGSYIHVEEDYLLLDIQEVNSRFTNENFQIEVFEMNENIENKISGSWTELIPLKFVKKNKELPIEKRNLADELNVNSEFVEYFFDLLVDEEISKDIFCDALRRNKNRKDLFADELLKKCDEMVSKKENVFDLPTDDDVEKCDF